MVETDWLDLKVLLVWAETDRAGQPTTESKEKLVVPAATAVQSLATVGEAETVELAETEGPAGTAEYLETPRLLPMAEGLVVAVELAETADAVATPRPGPMAVAETAAWVDLPETVATAVTEPVDWLLEATAEVAGQVVRPVLEAMAVRLVRVELAETLAMADPQDLQASAAKVETAARPQQLYRGWPPQGAMAALVAKVERVESAALPPVQATDARPMVAMVDTEDVEERVVTAALPTGCYRVEPRKQTVARAALVAKVERAAPAERLSLTETPKAAQTVARAVLVAKEERAAPAEQPQLSVAQTPTKALLDPTAERLAL